MAIFDQDNVLSLQEDHSPNSHSAVITILIAKALEEAKIAKTELDGVVFADGPGSYTGLRIGASAAKGLCYVLDLPLMSESNLSALCNESRHQNKSANYHISAIDARRKDVYLSIQDMEGKAIKQPYLVTIDEKFEEFLENLNSEISFSGNGSQKIIEILGLAETNNSNIFNSAANLRHCAFQLLDNQSFKENMFFEPNYMQAPKIIPSKKLLL